MREIVLDTETTGLDPLRGDRLVEVGCVEIFNRMPTGQTFHRYFNPERDMPPEAQKVHGLSAAFLSDKPKFGEPDVCEAFLEFVGDAAIIAHNAGFDRGFVNFELDRLGRESLMETRWIDTLGLAQKRFPGMYNSLDALCKRYSVDNSHRDYHGALLDARILAEVYLAMTGGQAVLTLSAESDSGRSRARHSAPARHAEGARIIVIRPSENELAAHEHVLALLDKASGGQTVWRRS